MSADTWAGATPRAGRWRDQGDATLRVRDSPVYRSHSPDQPPRADRHDVPAVVAAGGGPEESFATRSESTGQPAGPTSTSIAHPLLASVKML